jgi:hypothetical protein
MVPLDRLLFGVNPPAGMDWAVIGLWCARLRKTADPCDPPIVVTQEGEYYRVRDGRHRVIGALIAGRTHIAATIEEI